MLSSSTQALLDARDTSSVEGYRANLSQRIAQLKQEVQALQGCYNSLSWPNRIPPEILSKIFMLVARHSKHTDDGDVREEEDIRWIRVTHVCRYWRETALDCLALWTTLSFVKPEFTEVMVERSRNAPLSIDFGWQGGRGFQDVLSKVLSRTKQLRHVHLACQGNESRRLDLSKLLAVISGPAPVLEAVELFMIEEDDEVTLPARFLEGTAPHLKRLRLFNIRINDWNDLPLRSTLTDLRLQERMRFNLHTADTPISARPSWFTLHAALQEMPSLQNLTLEGFLPNSNLSTPLSLNPVTLHGLRSLWLRDQSSAIADFCSIVRFPEASRIEAIFNDTHDTPFLHRFLDILSGSCGALSKRPVYGLSYLDGGLSGGPRFGFNFEVNALEIGEESLVLSFARSALPFANDLTKFFNEYMNLSRLSAASFVSDPGLTKDTWITVFGAAKELTMIRLEHDSFSETLSQALRSTLNYDPPKPTFPALKSLEIWYHDINSETTSLLISALQSRPPSSPKIEVDFGDECQFDAGMCDKIVDSLPHVKVKLWADDDDDFEGDGNTRNGQEPEDVDGDEMVDEGEMEV